MSGPALVNSSPPILNAPTAGAICFARASAFSAVGTSSAAIIGFCITNIETAFGNCTRPILRGRGCFLFLFFALLMACVKFGHDGRAVEPNQSQLNEVYEENIDRGGG